MSGTDAYFNPNAPIYLDTPIKPLLDAMFITSNNVPQQVKKDLEEIFGSLISKFERNSGVIVAFGEENCLLFGYDKNISFLFLPTKKKDNKNKIDDCTTVGEVLNRNLRLGLPKSYQERLLTVRDNLQKKSETGVERELQRTLDVVIKENENLSSQLAILREENKELSSQLDEAQREIEQLKMEQKEKLHEEYEGLPNLKTGKIQRRNQLGQFAGLPIPKGLPQLRVTQNVVKRQKRTKLQETCNKRRIVPHLLGKM